ncbi:MAG TPA: porin family protein [Chitinophagales bacterium]|nr:porin family protein [Chitinophagales bacterium]
MKANVSAFLFLAALLGTFTVNAQVQEGEAPDPRTERVRRTVRLGLQFAPEISWFKAQDNSIQSTGTGIGYSFGPVVDFKFGENYALSTGINIVNARGGVRYLQDSVFFNSYKDQRYPKLTSADYRIRFVEIPILLRLSTNEIGYMTYFAHFGFVPGFAIGTKGDIEDATPSPNFSRNNENLGKDITPFNMSLQVGAGLSYSLTNTASVFAHLSFVNGFVDITNNPNKENNYKSKAILNRVPLTVGVYF